MRHGIRKRKQENIVLGRALYSAMILVLYTFGRTIPIPWLVNGTQSAKSLYEQNFIAGVLGSSNANASILMLGVMPYMTGSVIVSMFTQGLRSRRSNISPRMVQRVTLLCALFVAVLQGIMRSVQMLSRGGFVIRTPYDRFLPPQVCVGLTALLLVAGSFITILLADRNTRWGLGGSSLIILVNILDSGRGTFRIAISEWKKLGSGQGSVVQSGLLILYIAVILAILLLTILFERSELRIPVRHIMINNAYAEKDYIAIKLNPIGTMPIMYVMSFFMLPYYIFEGLYYLHPESTLIQDLLAMWTLQDLRGLTVFAVMLVLLTILMSIFMINPKNIAEDLEKSGDYIEDCNPGEETELELTHAVIFAAVMSSFMMIITSILPMAIGVNLELKAEIANLPMTFMIIGGISVQAFDQVRMLQTMERYKPFL